MILTNGRDKGQTKGKGMSKSGEKLENEKKKKVCKEKNISYTIFNHCIYTQMDKQLRDQKSLHLKDTK